MYSIEQKPVAVQNPMTSCFFLETHKLLRAGLVKEANKKATINFKGSTLFVYYFSVSWQVVLWVVLWVKLWRVASHLLT